MSEYSQVEQPKTDHPFSTPKARTRVLNLGFWRLQEACSIVSGGDGDPASGDAKSKQLFRLVHDAAQRAIFMGDLEVKDESTNIIPKYVVRPCQFVSWVRNSFEIPEWIDSFFPDPGQIEHLTEAEDQTINALNLRDSARVSVKAAIHWIKGQTAYSDSSDSEIINHAVIQTLMKQFQVRPRTIRSYVAALHPNPAERYVGRPRTRPKKLPN